MNVIHKIVVSKVIAMDIREHARFLHQVKNTRVFCSDCGTQIILDENVWRMICTTCNKSGSAEAELDADDTAFCITDKDGKRFYATIHPFITD